MDLKNIIRKVITEAHQKKILNEEGFKIYDISNSSSFPKKELKNKKYFILHHTAGRTSANGVVSILNKRGLGVQYIIDRDAKIYKSSKGSKAAHVAYFYKSAPSDMSNSTAEGVEIVANDDADILIPQCRSALILVKSLGYSLSDVYGHGEVSWNKQKTEGATCKAYFKKYWDKTEAEMPVIDNSLNVAKEDYGVIKKVDPAESAEYLEYALKSGELYNPSNVKITGVGELKETGKDGKKIFGLQRKSDKKIFLFKFETLKNVKYLEMDPETYRGNFEKLVNGTWGSVTNKGATGGVVKSSESEKTKSKSKNEVPENLLIGDSTCPWIEKNTKAKMISAPEGEQRLQKGGIGTPVLIQYLKKFPNVDSNVKNVVISIGTNDLYKDFGTEKLVNEIKTKFPNAKLMVVQGTFGDKIPCVSTGYCTLKKTTKDTVDKYYNKFRNLGVTVIEPPIGNVKDCHGPLDVYKKIGADIDSKLQ